VTRYANAEECRHQYIAQYFEDELEVCTTVCDNCAAPASIKADITIDAQKLLSSVYRTGQRFGQAYIVDVLRGSTGQKITDNGHDKLSVYGIGKELPKAYWERIMERLMEIGALKRGEFRALMIDALGMKILKQESRVEIKQERLNLKTKKEYVSHHEDVALNVTAFESLRALRAQIAKEEEKPAYVVFGDKTLKEMANALPQNKEQMLQLHGIGEVKYERYGKQFLQRCIELNSGS
jgi:ATP-dependent DNA helicase RecQ